MRVVVTGAAAHLARPLLPALCAQDWVTSVLGIDLHPSGFSHPKYAEQPCDIRDAKLSALMHGADTVIHLAFVVLRSSLGAHRKDRGLMRDINVNGSIRVFEAAAASGAQCLIQLSSASVYGAWPDNPALMTELQPRRAMTGFSYAQDKNEVEDWLERFQANTPQLRVVTLRPHVILGPNAHPFLRTLLRQPFYPYFKAPLPLTQCVWESDVVTAILDAIRRDVRGAFNLGADPALPFRDLLRHTQRYTIPLPFKALSAAHNALWIVSGATEEPGWLDGMRYSLAVDSSRAKSILGWTPRYSTLECARLVARG